MLLFARVRTTDYSPRREEQVMTHGTPPSKMSFWWDPLWRRYFGHFRQHLSVAFWDSPCHGHAPAEAGGGVPVGDVGDELQAELPRVERAAPRAGPGVAVRVAFEKQRDKL
jgi:hypothetical protein